jgi:hypothetical protein
MSPAGEKTVGLGPDGDREGAARTRLRAKGGTSVEEVEVINADDLTLEQIAKDIEAAIRRRQRAESAGWNGWRLEDWGKGVLGGWHLVYPAYAGGGYPIDIERFTTSAEMLDLVMQVARKGWATDVCLAGLVRALNDILQPQANLCTCGTDKTMTRKEIAARAARLGRRKRAAA